MARMRFALTAIVALCSIVGIGAQLPCGFTVGGDYYDLTPLYRAQYGPGGSGDLALRDSSPSNSYYSYFFGFCSTITYAPMPPSKASSFGQVSSHGGGPWSMASWKTNTPSATALPGGAKGLVLSMHNGDSCTPAPRVSIITLTCAQGGPVFPATPPTVDSTSTGCQYTFTMASSAACPSSGPTSPPPGPGAPGSKSISGGTIFLIILLVSTFLYIVLGCFYMTKYKGTTGRESCPNYTFWSSLPGLVKEGCMFTYHKLRGLCRRGGEEGYETVK